MRLMVPIAHKARKTLCLGFYIDGRLNIHILPVIYTFCRSYATIIHRKWLWSWSLMGSRRSCQYIITDSPPSIYTFAAANYMIGNSRFLMSRRTAIPSSSIFGTSNPSSPSRSKWAGRMCSRTHPWTPETSSRPSTSQNTPRRTSWICWRLNHTPPPSCKRNWRMIWGCRLARFMQSGLKWKRLLMWARTRTSAGFI